VDVHSQGREPIAAAPYHRPVILRFCDFKSNAYARLLGGSDFEPREENPMPSWGGPASDASLGFRPAFAPECQALRPVRQSMGLTNVIPMVPFCRTPEEVDAELAEMARQELRRGDNGLKVDVMCELPSNVIGVDAFAGRFDGVSIGSNDLSQLTIWGGGSGIRPGNRWLRAWHATVKAVI
jgi:pyruvate,water dikinase